MINDDAAEVRQQINTLFYELRSEHLSELQAFLEVYAASRSFQDQSHFFAEYLWENSTIFPDLTLSLIDIALYNTHVPEANVGFFGGEKLIRSVLRVYIDPNADEAMCRRAMNLFDRLMERFPGQSQHVIAEWDRR